MTTNEFPEGVTILLYTNLDGERRERWFRHTTGRETTAAVNPPVTLTPFPDARADEAAERYRLRGFTDVVVVR